MIRDVGGNPRRKGEFASAARADNRLIDSAAAGVASAKRGNWINEDSASGALCRSRRSGGRGGCLVGHFHVPSFPHYLGVVKGLTKLFCFFFGGENRSSQHVPALPVSSRRESRLLEEDARKRISAVVCDGIRSRLAGAHRGL